LARQLAAADLVAALDHETVAALHRRGREGYKSPPALT
jgi:hypothetical protein